MYMVMKSNSNLFISQEYKNWIIELKQKFHNAQFKVSVKVNNTLLEFYWELGADIIEKQKSALWGSGFLKQLSKDLISEFPDVKGFSERNLKFIRQWFIFYESENIKGKQLVSQIPWGQNIVIIQKCKSINEALFYVSNTIKYGWSRSRLSLQIKSDLYRREGKAVTNFDALLPTPDSDLAKQLLKDPYNFEFLTLTKNFKEQELEMGLLAHTEKFLLELGTGFAFVGRQYPIKVSETEYYLDLLFYHLELRSFVIIDLKVGKFKPEYAGKMNFYCNVVDDLLRKEGDASTIGMILCQEKDNIFVEYSLKNINTLLGVSEYKITESLPENLKSALPSVEEIEAELMTFRVPPSINNNKAKL